MTKKDHTNDNVQEAKNSLLVHIDFMKALLQHLDGKDYALRGKAVFAAHCLHRYINDRLINEMNELAERLASPTYGAIQ